MADWVAMIILRLGVGLLCWFPAAGVILAAFAILYGAEKGFALGGPFSGLALIGLAIVAGISPNARLAFGRCLKVIGVGCAIATALGILGLYPDTLAFLDPVAIHDLPVLALVIGGLAALLAFAIGFLITYDHEPGRPSVLARAVVPTLAQITGGAISDRRLRAHRRLDDGTLDGTGRFDENLPHLKGFNDYYRQSIARPLDDLERNRREARARMARRLLITLPPMLALSFYMAEVVEEEGFWSGLVGLILLFGWAGVLGYALGDSLKIKKLTKDFIIRRLSAFFRLAYDAQKHPIDLSLYSELGLIPDHQQAYCEESFSGQEGQVEMFMAEVEAHSYRDGGSRHDRAAHFSGAILQFTYRMPFAGRTIILSDPGMIDNILKQSMGDKQRVRLESLAFEEKFQVFADDEVEARYLLSPAFQERALRLAELIGKGSNIRFAFAEGQLLVAVAGWDLFEVAALSHAINDPVQIQTFINEIGLVLDIADILKLALETRI